MRGRENFYINFLTFSFPDTTMLLDQSYNVMYAAPISYLVACRLSFRLRPAPSRIGLARPRRSEFSARKLDRYIAVWG